MQSFTAITAALVITISPRYKSVSNSGIISVKVFKMPLYKIRKIGCVYQVITASGIVQYQSLKRRNVLDWLAENEPKEDEITLDKESKNELS